MKNIILVLFAILLFVYPQPVLGHSIGQPPFLKINDVFTDYYPVLLPNTSSLDLPQDINLKHFLINQDIKFELHRPSLPFPEEITNKSTLTWDFGDGQKGEGFTNQHQYSKAGSYILKIFIAYGGNEPALLQSTLIQILEQESYQVPNVILVVNDIPTNSSESRVLKLGFQKPIRFEARLISSSGNIGQVRWDFGDGQKGEGTKVTHQYDGQMEQVFPVVRVVDQQGFLTDAFVSLIDNKQKNDPVSAIVPSSPTLRYFWFIGIIGTVLGVVGTIIAKIFSWKRSKSP